MVPKVVGSNPIFHPNKTNEAERCQILTPFVFVYYGANLFAEIVDKKKGVDLSTFC